MSLTFAHRFWSEERTIGRSGAKSLSRHREPQCRALNHSEILKASLSGSQALATVSNTEFQAVAKIVVGPVKARFKSGRIINIQLPLSWLDTLCIICSKGALRRSRSLS